ncbi:ABC transporter [Bacillus sp. AFS002410]|nr:ABC transporter [Bacillus sp. AFS002410]
MKDDILKLLKIFNKKEKRKITILFIMMLMAAFFETIGIGLIIPFVGIVTSPEIIQKQTVLSYLYELFNFHSNTSFIIFLVVVLLSVFLLKNSFILFFQYLQYRVVLNQQVKLSSKLLREYLIKPYTFHLQRNTADLLRNVNAEVPKVFQGIVISLFQLITEILVTICILALLLITSPIATLTASLLLGGSVLLFLKFFRKKISYLGKEQQKVGGLMIKWVNQGLGASKEVKVSGKENFFIKSYSELSGINAKHNMFIKMLDQAPRLFIETLLVSVVLVTMIILIFQKENTSQLISTMALFAMAAFRLMPSINRIIGFIAMIRFSQPALSVIYEDLFTNNEQLTNNIQQSDLNSINTSLSKKYFKDEIKLQEVSFKYPNQKDYSVNNISLTIPIGKSVAFIGESGAGKTTIVDIILGLFQPDQGRVSVDGRDLSNIKSLWQKRIGYIPQSIYLTDDTIRCNVAFAIDVDEIDDAAVWKALEQAQLKDFVKSLPKQLDSEVGEQGIRLSGGQRQRIGIARALYHNPEILFMDEATSALDNNTEKEIMKAIDSLKGHKTLIIIAHRLSTIEKCDIVFKMNKGSLVEIDNKLVKSVM